jgi:hypothetical protein
MQVFGNSVTDIIYSIDSKKTSISLKPDIRRVAQNRPFMNGTKRLTWFSSLNCISEKIRKIMLGSFFLRPLSRQNGFANQEQPRA